MKSSGDQYRENWDGKGRKKKKLRKKLGKERKKRKRRRKWEK